MGSGVLSAKPINSGKDFWQLTRLSATFCRVTRGPQAQVGEMSGRAGVAWRGVACLGVALRRGGAGRGVAWLGGVYGMIGAGPHLLALRVLCLTLTRGGLILGHR